jgi:iron(III) transport system substrate-binding protein
MGRPFTMTRIFGAATLGMAFILTALADAPAQAKTALTVYTAVEADELAGFKQAFEAKNPEIEIKWVRDSTGIITAKLLAEKDNPRADIVWGLAATSLKLLADDGMLTPYAPKGLDQIDKALRDPAEPPAWIGQRVWISAVCFNTVEAKKRGLPVPKSWADLADPVYKGQIAMPNPNSSGTGFLSVSAWVQTMGEAKAWDYMTRLHDNIATYTHSGSKPCRQAGAGEYAIGISFDYRGAKVKADGAPVDVLVMSDGSGWDLESFGIVKGSKSMEAAKALADWSVSREANEIYAKAYSVVALPGAAKPIAGYPEGLIQSMIKNDFTWVSANRERLLTEWQKRFDGKTEPKS